MEPKIRVIMIEVRVSIPKPFVNDKSETDLFILEILRDMNFIYSNIQFKYILKFLKFEPK